MKMVSVSTCRLLLAACLDGVLGSPLNEGASVVVYPDILDLVVGDIDSRLM
jgi:hypothetical protein